MSSPGMWMPSKKDGKNWIVEYSGIHNGKPFSTSRKFRVRANAEAFIETTKYTLNLTNAVTNAVFKIKKIEK